MIHENMTYIKGEIFIIAILKPIFGFITSQVALFENPLHNYFAMYLIGLIAFEIAFKSVRKMQFNGLPRGEISSLVHWIIRLFCWFIMTLVVAFEIWVIKLVVLVPWWIWLMIILALVYILMESIRKNVLVI